MLDQPPLPKYRRPPVIETVLGVQFSPLRSFSIPHFGVFWNAIRSDYPSHEMKPPLGPIIEKFGVPPPMDAPSLNFMAEPEARCCFYDVRAPFVAPMFDGGVQLEWDQGGRHLEIDLLPDGTARYLTTDASKIHEGELGTFRFPDLKSLFGWLAATH